MELILLSAINIFLPHLHTQHIDPDHHCLAEATTVTELLEEDNEEVSWQFETCRHNVSWKYFEVVDQSYCVGEAGDHGSDPESQSESDFQRSKGLKNFGVF